MAPPLTDDDPTIVVDPLEPPPPIPPEAADPEPPGGPWGELRSELEGEEWSTDWIVERLTPIAKAPFELAALRFGSFWRVSDEEVRPILVGVADSIPRAAITDALVRRSPAIAAVIQLTDLVSTRVALTRQMLAASASSAQEAPTDAPPADRPRGIRIPRPFAAARPADGRTNGAARVDPVDEPGGVGQRRPGDATPDGTVPRGATLDHLLHGHQPANG